MLPPSWQFKTPLTAIIFDCDGTLSTIEGIDELAALNGVGDAVRDLTAQAMGKTGLTVKIYRQRLDKVQPSEEQVLALGIQYIEHLTTDTDQVIQLLQRLGKEIYIISAGLYPAVVKLGELLRIPAQNIFAVDIQFDSKGKFIRFDKNSPLTTNNGKRLIVTELMKKHRYTAYVGDGLNDCSVIDLVSRFVGYGGTFYRANIAALCQYYLTESTMAALLPLVLTQEEYEQLTVAEKNLYQKGFENLPSGAITDCGAS